MKKLSFKNEANSYLLKLIKISHFSSRKRKFFPKEKPKNGQRQRGQKIGQIENSNKP